MLPLEIAISKGHSAIAELLRPGIMEAMEVLMAAEGKFSTLSAEHLSVLAPLTCAAAAKAREAARRAR